MLKFCAVSDKSLKTLGYTRLTCPGLCGFKKCWVLSTSRATSSSVIHYSSFWHYISLQVEHFWTQRWLSGHIMCVISQLLKSIKFYLVRKYRCNIISVLTTLLTRVMELEFSFWGRLRRRVLLQSIWLLLSTSATNLVSCTSAHARLA